MIRRSSALAAVSALALASALAAAAPQGEPPVLALAREAIGGAARLQVKSISFKGTAEHAVVAPAGTNGASKQVFKARAAIDGQFVLPDSFRIRRRLPGGPETVNGLDGSTVRYAQWLPGSRPFVRDPPSAQSTMRASLHRAMLRLLIAWLLVPEGTFPVQYVEAGEADTAEGRADAVELRGADEFAGRLFFDKTSHRPFLLTWQEPPPFQVKLPRTPELRSDRPAQETGTTRHRDLIFKGLELPAGPPVQAEMRLADFRAIDGILFPHTMTLVLSTDTSETWRISSFKVNQPIDTKLFGRK